MADQLSIGRLPAQLIPSADLAAALLNCILLGSRPLQWLTNYL